MKRMVIFLMAVFIIAIAFIGCGVRFKDAPINLELPDDFKTRNLLDRTAIWRFNMPELAGTVLYLEQDGSYSRHRRFVKEGYVAILRFVEDSEKKIYSSRVDRGIVAEGSYLVFAANLDAKQIAEVNIEDVSLVFINDADIPWERLVEEANAQAPNPGIHRYWIQAALLSSITIDYYSEISTSASGVVGETFGAKGNVYNKQGTTAHDYKISLELIDLDRLRSTVRQMIPALKIFVQPAQKIEILNKSRVKSLLLKSIKE